jgi:hypothetical protein
MFYNRDRGRVYITNVNGMVIEALSTEITTHISLVKTTAVLSTYQRTYVKWEAVFSFDFVKNSHSSIVNTLA